MTDSVGFFDKAKVLEIVQREGEPSDKVVGVVCQALRRNKSLMQSFVRSVSNPAWIRALHGHGFFGSPPSTERTENSVRCDQWLEGQALVKLGASAPEVVEAVVTQTKTDNYNVYLTLVGAVKTLSPDRISALWPTLVQQLPDVTPSGLVLRALSDVAQVLIEAHFPDQVLLLLDTVLEPLPPTPETIVSMKMHTEARGMFAYHDLQLHLGPIIEAVRSQRPVAVIRLLEGKLLAALRLESEATGVNYLEVGYWRSAIEPTGQDFMEHHRDFVLEQLRGSAEHLVASGSREARDLIEEYLASSILILRRLGIHLVRVSASQNADLAYGILTSGNALDNTNVHHEVFLVLRDAYSVLAETEKSRVLSAILSGPGEARSQEFAQWVRDNTADKRPLADIKHRYTKSWIRDRLLMIKDALDSEGRQTLAGLDEELGERGDMPPEFTHYVGTSAWGTESPVSQLELRALSVREAVDYVLEWRPPPDAMRGFGPEPAGLARELRADLKERWSEYLPELSRLFTPRSFPVYACETLRFIAEHTRDRRLALARNETPEEPCFSWTDVFELVRAGVEAWPSLKTKADSCERGFAGSVRMAALDAMEEAIRSTEPAQQLRDAGSAAETRDLLVLLCADPDPDAEQDHPPEGYHGHDDPATVAINHIRPKALMTLMLYAVRRAEELQIAGVRWEPEVRDVVTHLLSDETLSVRSVYGKHWRQLYWLDEAWARARHEEIFPQCASKQEYLWAAWDSYVIFGGVAGAYYDLMRPLYIAAIDRAAEGRTSSSHLDPTSHLAGHLCVLYWQDIEEVPDPPNGALDNPLGRLFAQRPNKLHAAFARHLWSIGHSGDEAARDNWPKARRLWEHRLRHKAENAGQRDYARELAWFIHWLSLPGLRIEPEQARELIQESIGPLGAVVNSRGIDELIEYLAANAKSSPEVCVSLLDQVFAEHGAGWFFDMEKVRAILEAAIPSTPSCRDKAIAVVHRLGEYGHYSLRSLLDSLRQGR